MKGQPRAPQGSVCSGHSSLDSSEDLHVPVAGAAFGALGTALPWHTPRPAPSCRRTYHLVGLALLTTIWPKEDKRESRGTGVTGGRWGQEVPWPWDERNGQQDAGLSSERSIGATSAADLRIGSAGFGHEPKTRNVPPVNQPGRWVCGSRCQLPSERCISTRRGDTRPRSLPI